MTIQNITSVNKLLDKKLEKSSRTKIGVYK